MELWEGKWKLVFNGYRTSLWDDEKLMKRTGDAQWRQLYYSVNVRNTTDLYTKKVVSFMYMLAQ